MATTRNFVEKRVELLEKLVKELGERLDKIELFLGIPIDDSVESNVECRLNSLETKTVEVQTKVKECRESLESEVSASLGRDTRLTEVEDSLGELSSKILAVNLKCDDLVEKGNLSADEIAKGKEHPKSKGGNEDGSSLVVKSRGSRLGSGGLKVAVVGDSLARGAGYKFKKQCPEEVEVKALGGAKLSKVREEIRGMKEDKSKVLVVVAGANNVVDDDASTMIDEYISLVKESKRVTDKLVVVGLTKRYDLGPKYEDKRITINYRLKRECKPDKMNFTFMEYEPDRRSVHEDGLHLNSIGQNELGRKMYSKCVDFLE